MGPTGVDFKAIKERLRGAQDEEAGDDDFRQACPERYSIILPQWFQRGYCKWPLQFSNYS